MASKSVDFISGKHCVARIFLDNKPWNIKVKSMRVEELATEVADQVNGENRARFQKLTDGYRVTAECYEDGSSNLLENWIANQANEDANMPRLDMDSGIVFSYLDGSKKGVQIQDCTLDALDINMGGRTDRVMNTVKFRAKYFKQLQV